MEETAKAPFWKPALIYGAILGFAGILLNVIFYLMNLSVERWAQWISLVITILVMVYCLVAYRKEYLGGYATFGQIFLMALVIGIISTLLGTIYTYLLYTVIDPELIEKVKLVTQERIMNNPRIPESMYEDVLARIDRSMTPERMTRNALLFGPIVNAIIGLILAAFIKKSRPENPVA
jgi:hypothetical protein